MINGIYYKITVYLNSTHLFSTNTSDEQYTNQQIRNIKTIFIEKFPATEGYSIEIESIRATSNRDSLTGPVAN